jgi:predicted  nucleic acid-binding Zn-ribbon protein
MEKFECPKCGKVSFSASKDLAKTCPYCDTEKLLIFNPNILAMAHELSDAKIVIDRRNSQRAISTDRRDNSCMIPVAWLVVKQKELAESAT